MLKSIRPDEVEIGMYVQGFAGGWLSHPFWRARFLVRCAADLTRLRDAGVDVLIDTAKGADVAPPCTAHPPRTRRIAPPPPPIPPWPPRAAPARKRLMPPLTFGKADKARATALASRSTRVVAALFENGRVGRAVSTPAILAVVDEIADALEHNSAAFVSVTRLKAKDDYTYTHSVAVCALMISLARETGAPAEVVQALGTAGLLHDIGKVFVDDAVLKKEGALTDAERTAIRRHTELGHALLLEEPGLPPAVLDVCLHHHERLDGTGYPFGLAGDGVSQAVRIASICDVYDALTSDRPYRRGMLPVEALLHMESSEGEFDAGLLFRFMRSINVYPPGKLIRLRSNRLAIALAPHPNRRPVVRAFYSTVDTNFIPPEDLVLSGGLDGDQAMSAEDPARWFSTDWPEMARRVVGGNRLS